MIRHQLVIVGGGLAGLRAAVEAKDAGIDVAILSQVHPGRSHSGAAQGGINAALANNPEGHDDTPEKHAFDTVKGSDYLADQDAVYQMTQDAPPAIFEMEHWGCPFSRYDDGRISQRPFGGAGFPRTCYGADKTGHYLLHTLVEQAYRHEVAMYVEQFVTSLIVADGRCRGVVAYDMIRGGFEAFVADAVIIATGGAGRTYSNTTNAIISTGYGAAMAYHAGVPLKDMEFVQFHPTGLYTTNILMTEGCRGEGAYLLNDLGERFMERYAPNDDGARPARHHGALHLDRDPRGARHRRQGLRLPRPAPPGRTEDRRKAPRHPRPRHSLRGRRPGDRAGADRAQPALHHGRHRHRPRRRHPDARALRRRRVRLRERARRQPPGGQLAARDDRLRAPRRQGGRRVPLSATTRRRRPTRPPARPWAPCRSASIASRARRPPKTPTTSAPR